jgi:hypothetical protein
MSDPNATPRKELLEITKIEKELEKHDKDMEEASLRIEEFKRSAYKRSTFWLAIASVVIAVIGVLGQFVVSSIKAEFAKLEVATAQFKQEKAEAARTKAEDEAKKAEGQRDQARNEIAALDKHRQSAQQELVNAKLEYTKALESKDDLDRTIALLQSEVKALNSYIEQKKALPLEARIKFKGKTEPASPDELRSAAGDIKRTKRYYMWVDVPSDPQEKVVKVTYYLNNPLFANPVLEGQGETFETYYIGRSCLSTIVATFVIEDNSGARRSAQRVLNLCAIVGDDRQ